MHVELPKKGALGSIKAFAGEYAMIVVSILTALALEHAAQGWHHRHRAAEAQTNIEAEIRHNLDELQSAIRKNETEYQKLSKLRTALRQDLRDKLTSKEMIQRFMTATGNEFGINLTVPTLRHEAWDVAVASQAASWIDPGRLRQYSGAYAMQRDVEANASNIMRLMFDGPAMFNTVANLELGNIDGVGLYHAVVQMQGTVGATVQTLQSLEKEFRRAVPKA